MRSAPPSLPGAALAGARSRRGAAALEFGLVAPILITLLLAVSDIGGAIQQNIRLEAAARSALGYAHLYSDTNQLGTIRNYIITALNGWNDVTVSNVVATCDCATTANGVTTAVNGTCGVACTAGQEGRRFLTVAISRPYNGILFMQGRTLQGNIVLRVE